MKFEPNVREAIKYMEYATMAGLKDGDLTLYAVVCINEDGASSHGGEVVSVIAGRATRDSVRIAIDETIARTLDHNEMASKAEREHNCKYVPIALGLPVQLLPDISRQLFKLPPVDGLDKEVLPE